MHKTILGGIKTAGGIVETRLEIFTGQIPEQVNDLKDRMDKKLLPEGWLHTDVSLAVNSHSGWIIMAVIYKREYPQPPPPTR